MIRKHCNKSMCVVPCFESISQPMIQVYSPCNLWPPSPPPPPSSMLDAPPTQLNRGGGGGGGKGRGVWGLSKTRTLM